MTDDIARDAPRLPPRSAPPVEPQAEIADTGPVLRPRDVWDPGAEVLDRNGLPRAIRLQPFVAPEMRPTRVLDVALVSVRAAMALVMLVFWAIVSQAGAGEADRLEQTVPVVTVLAIGLVTLWFVLAAVWSDRRAQNVHRLAARYPSRMRAIRVWFYPLIWVALMSVTLVRVEPNPDFDVRPAIIVTGFAITMLPQFLMLQRIYRSLIRVVPDATIFVLCALDIAAFGLIWWRLTLWWQRHDTALDGGVGLFPSLTVVAGASLAIGAVLVWHLTVEANRAQFRRERTMLVRHDHRLARLQGLDPMDPATRWALLVARQAADAVAEPPVAAGTAPAEPVVALADPLSAGSVRSAPQTSPQPDDWAGISPDWAAMVLAAEAEANARAEAAGAATAIEAGRAESDVGPVPEVSPNLPSRERSHRPTRHRPPAIVDPIEASPPEQPVIEPAVTEPADAEPAVTELALTELAVTELAVTEPVVTEPVVTELAVTDEPAELDESQAAPEVTEPAVAATIEASDVVAVVAVDAVDAAEPVLARRQPSRNLDELKLGTLSAGSTPFSRFQGATLGEVGATGEAATAVDLATRIGVALERGGGADFGTALRSLSERYGGSRESSLLQGPDPLHAFDEAPISDADPPRLIVVEFLRYVALAAALATIVAAAELLRRLVDLESSSPDGGLSAADVDRLEVARALTWHAVVAIPIALLVWALAAAVYAHHAGAIAKALPAAIRCGAGLLVGVVLLVIDGDEGGVVALVLIAALTALAVMALVEVAATHSFFGNPINATRAWSVTSIVTPILLVIGPLRTPIDESVGRTDLAFFSAILCVAAAVGLVLAALSSVSLEGSLRGSSDLAQSEARRHPAGERRSAP